ncbi:MAG: ABC transporter permease [Trueperaceae bacterium]|nr:ABC transporter permease [Trueperaceae bacterium]
MASARRAATRTPFGLFVRSGAGVAGALMITTMVLASLFAPLLAPFDPLELIPADRLQGPSTVHPLGTDQYGRDTFSRILYGGRSSLAVAALSILFAASIGSALGLVGGYFRGWLDGLMMRITDVLLSFPAILLAIALLAFFGGGFWNLVFAIGVIYIGPFARVARAAALAVREEPYVEAGRALGATNGRILLRAILPNAAAPLLVEVTLRLAYAILAEASLSFLGLGTQPPTPSWGQMIAEGRRFLALSPWATVAPGLAIMLSVLGFNLLGDGLRDVLDPRLRRR